MSARRQVAQHRFRAPFKVRDPEDALAPPEGLHFTHHKDMNNPPPRGATLRMAKAETRLDGLRAATRGKARSPDYSLKFHAACWKNALMGAEAWEAVGEYIYQQRSKALGKR